jgi:hypothetical protein
MAPAAVHEDLKLGVEHLRAWKRVALVTDIEWMTHLTALFGSRRSRSSGSAAAGADLIQRQSVIGRIGGRRRDAVQHTMGRDRVNEDEDEIGSGAPGVLFTS